VARSSYRVRFAGGSGFQLAGIVDRPDDVIAPPVAVFSHCFTCNKDLKAIVRISRGLAESGVAVLRFDMTGLGGSEGDFSKTSFTTNMADLRAAIEFASVELGPVTALLGHSFGGAVCLAVAGSYPQSESQPRAVVTLAAPSDTKHLALLLARMDPKIETTGVGAVSIGGLGWKIRREMLEDFRTHDLPAAISKIRAATLLLHSPVDAIVGFDHALRIMGLIQSSPETSTPVSLVSLKGADHLLAETPSDIEYVTSTVAAFLRRYARQ
jgi:putative redox protein